MHVVSLLERERESGRTAIKEILPMRPGDVETTYADTAEREHDIGFRSFRTIDDGIARFANGIRSITGSSTGRDE
jgi:UDP-glucuronate 4-epimerase